MSDTGVEGEFAPKSGAKPPRARRASGGAPPPQSASDEGGDADEAAAGPTSAAGAVDADAPDLHEGEAGHELEASPTPGRRKQRTPRSASGHAAVGFPWEVSPLATFSMAELLEEIDRRHARAKALLAERERIQAKMEKLEARMGGGGGGGLATRETVGGARAASPRRPRAKNSVSLADALAMAVEPRATVSPAEAAELALSNGYQSTAKNFGMVVANALSKDARFKRVGRGRYERVADGG